MSNENPKWMPKQRFWTDYERDRLVREHGEMAALLERLASAERADQNETQWTPGPWTLKMRHRDSAIIETRDRIIASLMQYGDTDRAADANARLIAAAPEMVAMLEEIELRLCQTRLAAGIGRKSSREQFLLGETQRIETDLRALLAKIKKGA